MMSGTISLILPTPALTGWSAWTILQTDPGSSSLPHLQAMMISPSSKRPIKTFNDASKTVKFSENVKETDSGDILIKFLPEEGLKAIDLNTAADYRAVFRCPDPQGIIPG